MKGWIGFFLSLACVAGMTLFLLMLLGWTLAGIRYALDALGGG